MGQGRIKDPLNCPFCESFEKGVSATWGLSPEGWEEMKARHLEKHCCPTCGQPVVNSTLDAFWEENPWVLD